MVPPAPQVGRLAIAIEPRTIWQRRMLAGPASPVQPPSNASAPSKYLTVRRIGTSSGLRVYALKVPTRLSGVADEHIVDSPTTIPVHALDLLAD